MMRYRVFVDATKAKAPKAVDHLYWGQREEMDYFEFQALQWSFRLRIANAIDLASAVDGAAPVQGLHAGLISQLRQKIAAL
jgi:hypothetical protein